MGRSVLIFFLVQGLTVGCAHRSTTGEGASPAEAVSQPETRVAAPVIVPDVEFQRDGWEMYGNAARFTVESVADVTPDNDTPEAAVIHFFASRIRGDDAWEDVVPDEGERSAYLQRSLEQYRDWRFLALELMGRNAQEDGSYWIKIYMEISFQGEVETGTDTVEVHFLDGRWVLTRVPS